VARRGVFQFENFLLDRQSRELFRRDEAGAFVPMAVGSRALKFSTCFSTGLETLY
jgi:hypothetical protein